MEQNKNKIVFFGAFAVTILLNFQRFLLVLADPEGYASAIGLTLEAFLIRMFLFFVFAYLILSFNTIWKHKWIGSSTKGKTLNIIINLALFIVGVMTITFFMHNYLTGTLIREQVFVVTASGFLFVHSLLLVLARFINLNLQHQQIVMEKEQAKQKALQHQLEALRSQINPHFLFNALNSLTILIRNKSDRALAFVEQLSWLLRATLLRSEDDFITIQNELEYLDSYVFLQKERFGEKFMVDIHIPEKWKKELIPSFSLQLLAENAIKHNIVSKESPLLLEIFPEGQHLVIRNRIQKRRDATEGTGTGLLNLSVRFKLLKQEDVQINQDENFFTVKLPITNK